MNDISSKRNNKEKWQNCLRILLTDILYQIQEPNENKLIKTNW